MWIQTQNCKNKYINLITSAELLQVLHLETISERERGQKQQVHVERQTPSSKGKCLVHY